MSERLSQVSAQRIKIKTEKVKKNKRREKRICRRVKCKGFINFKYKVPTETNMNHLNNRTV